MKLIIASIDAIFKKDSADYFEGIKGALDTFEAQHDENKVVIISIHRGKLNALPDDFHKIHIRGWLRRSPALIDIIVKDTGLKYQDILILGSKDVDMQLAANSKLLLLTADYAKKNNPTDRIYTEGYGIGILSPDRLSNFITHYLDIKKPWFYSLDVDDSTKLYGLTDAMTNNQKDVDVKKICVELRTFLKAHNIKNRSPFFIYTLMSVYQIYKEMEGVKYWGYYPSSTTDENEELSALKEIMRKSFKSSMTKENILIRHKNSIPRKTMGSAARLKDGCDSQFDSIHVNPWFKGKIEGQDVCIIDDFTNHGTSSETTRMLLKKAGVNKIVFITLGKFRYDYKVFDYSLKGDVYTPNGFTYLRNGDYKSVTGIINNKSSNELLEALKEIIN